MATDTVVLVVDDDELDITIIERVFRRRMPDVKLDKVTDGEQALEYLETHVPDLIVMDIRMPKMDGLEALVRIKANDGLKQVPVVMMSTSDDQRDIEFCYREHANAYVTKSFGQSGGEPNAIDQMIEFWLGAAKLPPKQSR